MPQFFPRSSLSGASTIYRDRAIDALTTVNAQKAVIQFVAAGAVPQIISVGQVVETDLAQPAGERQLVIELQAIESDLAQQVKPLQLKILAQITEADTAEAVVARGRVTINQIVESDLAQHATEEQIVHETQAFETDFAQQIKSLQLVVANQLIETDLAEAVAKTKIVALGQSQEADAPSVVTTKHVISLNQVSEVDSAQSISELQSVLESQALETSISQAVAPVHVLNINEAIEDESAFAVTTAGTQIVVINQATEVNTPQQVTVINVSKPIISEAGGTGGKKAKRVAPLPHAPDPRPQPIVVKVDRAEEFNTANVCSPIRIERSLYVSDIIETPQFKPKPEEITYTVYPERSVTYTPVVVFSERERVVQLLKIGVI